MIVEFTSGPVSPSTSPIAHVVDQGVFPAGLEPVVAEGAKASRFAGKPGQCHEAFVTRDGAVVAAGHKQGFCFEDSLKYGDNRSHGYDCTFQGITSGWGNTYNKQLVGQWIDITGVPEGGYIVRITINMIGLFE